MAFQAQSPYSQGLDTNLQGLVAGEADVANRGLMAQNMAQQQAQAQAEMQQRGAIAQQNMQLSREQLAAGQQMQAQEQAHAMQLQKDRQAHESSQTQILIAEQKRMAEQEKKDAMKMMELEAQLTLAEAQDNEQAVSVILQKKKDLQKRRADAARNLAVLGKQAEATPKMISNMSSAIQQRLGEMKNQLDAKKKLADTFYQDVKGQIVSMDLEGGSSAITSQRNTQNTGFWGTFIGQNVPDLSQDATVGMQFLDLQQDILGAGGFSPLEEPTAGMVKGVMSDVSMIEIVAGQTAKGLVKALSTVPGAKVDTTKAAEVVKMLLTSSEGKDFSQELMQAGLEPEVGKIIMQNLARDAQRESMRIKSELTARVASGAQVSLETKALEAAAKAYGIRAEQLARGASRIATMDLSQYEAMTESWGRLERAGNFEGLTGFAPQMKQLGIGDEYSQMLDLMSQGQMGPMLSQPQLNNRVTAAGVDLDLLAEEDKQLEDELAALMAGSRTKGAKRKLDILRERMR
jgi:hypothetical protein